MLSVASRLSRMKPQSGEKNIPSTLRLPRTQDQSGSLAPHPPLHTPMAGSDKACTQAYRATPPLLFSPHLEASLDELLDFGRCSSTLCTIITTLVEPVKTATSWPDLLTSFLTKVPQGRVLLEQLLFLMTRTLLPNQVMQNRELMFQLYTEKTKMPVGLRLRYDMLRQWKMYHGRPIMLGSDHTGEEPEVEQPKVGPREHIRMPQLSLAGPVIPRIAYPRPSYPLGFIRPLDPHIIEKLTAPPVRGYETEVTRKKMRHHVTALDSYLLMTEDGVRKMGSARFIVVLSAIITQWQWLRNNNEVFASLAEDDWEDLEDLQSREEWFVFL